ncbi:nickel pincer cofactor biosynthesis protein LarC [Stieleria tagensis]|uniref:nickel pincer cofactor biosynthesis protein LarC n=1 Tax=Stieleria tagensis TaxID=2956795 RepID=UPI0036F31760
MTRFAYFDCFSGISGDMTLAALIDLGVETSELQEAVRSLGLPKISITSQDVKKSGFRAVSVQIDHPPEHAHRHLHHITDMIDAADQIDSDAKELAKRIFGHVAVAEAKVHGTSIEKVHFHEVGAIDSIADIVGAAVGICRLGIRSASASPVPTGCGSIKIAHGNVAVPAPATAEILRGIPIAPTAIAAELTTPTGAAILKELCSEFGPVPAMTIDRIGYGAGTMDLPEQANMLRVLLGSRTGDSAAAGHQHTDHDTVAVLETNLDDATGEQLADCTTRLMEAGALDVTQTPCMMKKGRSGVVLAVMTRPEQIATMEDLIFRHTPSIGIRRHLAHRDTLRRESIVVPTRLGPIAAKTVHLPDGQQRMKIENDQARKLASEHQLSTADVQRIADRAMPEG